MLVLAYALTKPWSAKFEKNSGWHFLCLSSFSHPACTSSVNCPFLYLPFSSSECGKNGMMPVLQQLGVTISSFAETVVRPPRRKKIRVYPKGFLQTERVCQYKETFFSRTRKALVAIHVVALLTRR